MRKKQTRLSCNYYPGINVGLVKMKNKILLVEDDLTMLNLLEILFSLEGYEVCSVNQEEDYFDSVMQNEPDLVIMDVHLRKGKGVEINGFDLLRKIKEEPSLRDIKVIMLSGTDLRVESRIAGADEFIIKPFMPDELTRKIEILME